MLTNPFARDRDGLIVHISDALDSPAPFSCPGCSQPISLVAESVPYRRGDSSKEIRKRSHFRHVGDHECGSGPETALHEWAKLIIEEAMTISLPLHEVTYKDMARTFETNWSYHAVTTEEWQDGIRPDVVLHHGEGRLNVEVRVHHAVDERKASILRDRGDSCIEIDLNAFDFDRTSGADLRREILVDAPRYWISHKDQKVRETIVKQEWESGLQNRAFELGQEIARIPPPPSDAAEIERFITIHGIEPWIERQVPGSHVFDESARYWQARTVINLLDLQNRLGLMKDEEFDPLQLKQGPLSNANIRALPEYEEELMLAAGYDRERYSSPADVITGYLSDISAGLEVADGSRRIHMLKRGIDVNQYILDPTWVRGCLRMIELERVHSHIRDSDRSNPPDMVEFTTWLDMPVASRERTPRKLARTGGQDFYRLLAHVVAISEMVSKHTPGPRTRHLLGIMSREEAQSRSSDKPSSVWYFNNPYCEDALQRYERTQDLWSAMVYAITDKKTQSKLLLPMDRLGGTSAHKFVKDVPSMLWAIAHAVEAAESSRPQHSGGYGGWKRWR